MVGTFRMGTTSSTAMQSLGRGNRTTRADCRCENVVFVFLSRSDPAGCPLDGVHSSNDHCVAVYGSILMRFSTFFFRSDRSFRRATQFSFSSLDGATIFAKLLSKIAKNLKIGGKVCAHNFV